MCGGWREVEEEELSMLEKREGKGGGGERWH